MDYFTWIEEVAEILSLKDGVFKGLPIKDIVDILNERIEGLPLVFEIHKPSSHEMANFANSSPLVNRVDVENVSFMADFKKKRKKK